ncbi:MAG TPA: TetR/AcrR family transcriptional regulator [Mycobacterium sp.]|jgi:AcrR family transcriptional regulator
MAAIREATRAELADHGYPRVTFEGVARRAKTSKPVLYRRYRSRAHMVVDALLAVPRQPVPACGTPSLREEMLALLDAMMARFRRIGIDTYRSVIADADDELVDTITAQLAELADQTIYRALSDARERGEIGAAEIPERAATAIAALMRNELFFSRGPVGKEALIDILDNVYLPLIEAVSHRSNGQRGATIPLS